MMHLSEMRAARDRPSLQTALDLLRMGQWLCVALVMYYIAFEFGLQETRPGVQSTINTIANVCLRTWLGYAAARSAFGKLSKDDDPLLYVARAIVMAGVFFTTK